MKLLFFSDIHGVPSTVSQLLDHADALKPDMMVLLGDVLYHGPRNGVPGFYDPPQVVELLNGHRRNLLAVRGNCDAEVDQMLLKFPMMADFSEVVADGVRFYVTHGHLWNRENPPPVPEKTVLVHGHTHIPECSMLENNIMLFNPGSVSLPKSQSPRSFGFFENGELTVRRLDDGEVFLRMTLR